MTASSLPRTAPHPVATFRKAVLVVALLALGALTLLGVLVHAVIRVPGMHTAQEPAPSQALLVPEVITRVQGTTPLPAVAPMATPVTRTPLDTPTEDVGPKAPTQQRPSVSPVPPQLRHQALGTPEGTVLAPKAQAHVPPKRWAMLARPADQPQPVVAQGAAVALDTDGRLVPVRQAPGLPSQGGEHSPGHRLITPATWEIPVNPLKTIYRSQTLAGQLLQAVHSDLPGQLTIRLTVPVLDKFGQDTVILPMNTLIIATQDGTPVYGNTRLKVTLQQLELPTGEVVALKASVGDEDGANGLPGTVNNHYGKVLLATGIAALVNIGVQSAVGTPGPGQFFRNPLQDAAQDVGASVQQETQRAVDRELRVPPTITRQALTFCTIHLAENIQFNRPPVVVK